MPAIGLARPEALLLLGAAAVLGPLAVWVEVRRGRAVRAFAGPGSELSSVSAGRRRAKLALGLAATVAAILALSGPYFDVVERTVVQSGVDLVVALDVSQSMAVRDVDPDRLRAAKQFIEHLGDRLTQSRVALVLFAGQGVIRYPSTADPAVLGQALGSVSAGFRPAQGGSSLRGAVDAALRAFSSEARESARRKAVIVVSDGEETLGSIPDLDALRQANVRLFTIGVGTPSGGPIPTYDRNGRFGGYLKRIDGTQVVSRLDEDALRALASRTGGRYWRLGSDLGTVRAVITELMRLDASRLRELPGGSVPDDRYQPILALAVMALVAEGLLSERRAMPHPRWLREPRPRSRRRLSLPLFARLLTLLLASALLGGACGGPSAREADQLYLAGNAQGALDRYRALVADHPEIPELHVNAGNALHQLGQYAAALDAYQLGIRDGDPSVRAVALYQRGNTLFRLGKLEEAREAYKGALRIDPRDRDAKFNIEVIDAARALRLQDAQQSGPQPGRSGPPQPSGQQGEGQPGESAPGQPPSGQAPQGPPGSEGPQVQGPPTTDTQQTGPSVAQALRQFRSTLSPEEALRLLDALLNDQRGIQLLIEGPQPTGPQRQDPTY